MSFAARAVRLLPRNYASAAARRSFSADAAAEAKAAPAVVVKKGGSSFFQRVTSFLVGAGVAGGCGYFWLHQDVWEATDALAGTIRDMRLDQLDANEVMRERINKLENQVAELQAGK